VTAVIGVRSKVLAHVIGTEQRGAAGRAVHGRGLNRRPQVSLRRHVTDGIVDEDAVELTPEPDAAHIAFDMLALRVQAVADLEHAGRAIDENHAESRLEE